MLEVRKTFAKRIIFLCYYIIYYYSLFKRDIQTTGPAIRTSLWFIYYLSLIIIQSVVYYYFFFLYFFYIFFIFLIFLILKF